jgi:CubicO group peptidase (beta-lactamase class C family)
MFLTPLSHALTRRKALLAALAGTALTACGSGGDDLADPAPETPAGQAAREAVAAGLVSAVFGTVAPDRVEVAAAGHRRIDALDAVSVGDPYALGSNTKAMTAAAIAALVQQGLAAWTTTVGDVMPAAGSAFAQVTLGQLLDHRGGLPAFNGSASDEAVFLAAWMASGRPMPATLMQRRAVLAAHLLAGAPAAGVVPGRDFHYSNAGYALAAAMVEALAGRPFEQLFDEVLVKPLGLSGAWRSLAPIPDGQPDRHQGERDALARWLPDAEIMAADPWAEVLGPAGQWVCAARSHGEWLRWHLVALQGGTTPLAAAYLQRLRAAADNDYVLGWQGGVHPTLGRMFAHTGHVAGFMAEVVVRADGRRAVFGLTNTGHMAADGSSWVLEALDTRMLPLMAG